MSERTCGICATCRWWDREDECTNHDATPPVGWRACLLTVMGMGAAEHAWSLAVAWDHEQYRAELWTAPDFGCVQWAAKEDLG